jgi:hypothetical protein
MSSARLAIALLTACCFAVLWGCEPAASTGGSETATAQSSGPAPPPPPPPPPQAPAPEPADTQTQPADEGEPAEPIPPETETAADQAAPPEDPDRPLTPQEARAAVEELGGRVSEGDSGQVVKVFLNRTAADDQQVRAVAFLPAVEVLNLTGTQVGDEGLGRLRELKNLKRVYAAESRVTDQGVQALEQAIPGCAVYR